MSVESLSATEIEFAKTEDLSHILRTKWTFSFNRLYPQWTSVREKNSKSTLLGLIKSVLCGRYPSLRILFSNFTSHSFASLLRCLTDCHFFRLT